MTLESSGDQIDFYCLGAVFQLYTGENLIPSATPDTGAYPCRAWNENLATPRPAINYHVHGPKLSCPWECGIEPVSSHLCTMVLGSYSRLDVHYATLANLAEAIRGIPVRMINMQSIDNLATNLKQRDGGVWVSNDQSEISYPDEGNQQCLHVEDSSFWFKHRNNCIVEAMGQYPPPGLVLDIGGGNGFVSNAINNAGMETILLEPGLQGVLNAKARGLAPVIHSTLQDAGFKSGSIPAAGLFDVLEHIEHDVAFLKDIEKILEPGGRVYLTVPAYNFLHSYEDEEAGHYRRYTKRSLSSCVRQAGLEVDFVSYIFALLPLPIFLFRTLPGKFSKNQRKGLMQTETEHTKPPSIFGTLLDALFACGSWLISKKLPLPFGGSCLLVARKPR